MAPDGRPPSPPASPTRLPPASLREPLPAPLRLPPSEAGYRAPERLRRVFDHRDPMRRGQLQDGRHVGALSEQVHRNDRLHP